MRSRIFAAALALGAFGWSQSVFATVLISNFPQANDTDGSTVASITGDFSKAAGFTMPAGQDYLLNSITLRLEVNNVTASLSLALYGDSGTDPIGPALLDFVNPALPAGVDDFVFAPAAAFQLDASTTYWIVATGESPEANGIIWLASQPGITPTGIATSAGYRFDDTGVVPPTGSSGILNTYQVDGTAIAVAEPTTLALFGFGLAGLGFAARRRRTA